MATTAGAATLQAIRDFRNSSAEADPATMLGISTDRMMKKGESAKESSDRGGTTSVTVSECPECAANASNAVVTACVTAEPCAWASRSRGGEPAESIRAPSSSPTTAATARMQSPDLSAVPASERGEALVRHLIARWEDAATGEELMLLLRTAVTSDEVAAQLQDVLRQLIAGPVAAMGVGEVEERSAFIQTQMLGLALCRYVLRQEPLASLPLAQVVAAVAPSVQRYLETPYPAADGVPNMCSPTTASPHTR